MKRSKTRIILFIVVVSASLASYIFLNNTVATQARGNNVEQTEIDENFEEGDPKMVLPDVEMIKRVLETGKRLIPAS